MICLNSCWCQLVLCKKPDLKGLGGAPGREIWVLSTYRSIYRWHLNIYNKHKSIWIWHMLRTGWWFGTCFIFPYIGNVIIPTDFHIFRRVSKHQPDLGHDDTTCLMLISIDWFKGNITGNHRFSWPYPLMLRWAQVISMRHLDSATWRLDPWDGEIGVNHRKTMGKP